jgi:hypothetical protein
MGSRSVKADPVVEETQKKAEDKVVAQEQKALADASSRLRLMQTGGLRLLFSPLRNQTSEGSQLGKSLGTGM